MSEDKTIQTQWKDLRRELAILVNEDPRFLSQLKILVDTKKGIKTPLMELLPKLPSPQESIQLTMSPFEKKKLKSQQKTDLSWDGQIPFLNTEVIEDSNKENGLADLIVDPASHKILQKLFNPGEEGSFLINVRISLSNGALSANPSFELSQKILEKIVNVNFHNKEFITEFQLELKNI